MILVFVSGLLETVLVSSLGVTRAEEGNVDPFLCYCPEQLGCNIKGLSSSSFKDRQAHSNLISLSAPNNYQEKVHRPESLVRGSWFAEREGGKVHAFFS